MAIADVYDALISRRVYKVTALKFAYKYGRGITLPYLYPGIERTIRLRIRRIDMPASIRTSTPISSA